MSLYRPKRSPYWHFDFQIQGYRFSGSTRLADQHHAQDYEANEKAKAKRLIDAIAGIRLLLDGLGRVFAK